VRAFERQAAAAVIVPSSKKKAKRTDRKDDATVNPMMAAQSAEEISSIVKQDMEYLSNDVLDAVVLMEKQKEVTMVDEGHVANVVLPPKQSQRPLYHRRFASSSSKNIILVPTSELENDVQPLSDAAQAFLHRRTAPQRKRKPVRMLPCDLVF
jgi:hypothetical protein